MFATVGHSPPLAPGRRLQAGLLSALLQGGLFFCLLGLVTLSPKAPPLELPDPGVLIELAPAVAAAGPTDPGPPKASAGPKRRAAVASAPPPVAPTKEAEPSPTPPTEPAADAAPAALSDEGEPEGGGEGSEGGDGGEGGEGGGEGGGGGAEPPAYRPIQTQQARITRSVAPRVPEAFHQLDLAEARCTVRLFLDERGRVVEARPEDCPSLLRASALTAAYATRFAPLRDENGTAYRAQFVIHYRFVRP